MTKRKNPDFDSRTGGSVKRKRTRRTPEELERARKRGENVRDQRGGERRRSIKVNGKRLSAEDRGLDKRFTDDKIKSIQLQNDLDKAIDWRHTLQDRLEDTTRSLNAEAKREGKISMAIANKQSQLQGDLRRQNDKIENLRHELSVVKTRIKS